MKRTARGTFTDDARPCAAIDRRALLRASLLGGPALVAGVIGITSTLASEAERSPHVAQTGDSSKVTTDLVKRVARSFFDYKIPAIDADAITRTAAATLRVWHSIDLRRISPIDPPFDFSLVCTEAERLMKKRE